MIDYETSLTKFTSEISMYIYKFIFTMELQKNNLFNLNVLSKEISKLYDGDILNTSEYKGIFSCVEIILDYFINEKFINMSKFITTNNHMINKIYFPKHYLKRFIKQHNIFKTLPYILPPDKGNRKSFNLRNHTLSGGISDIKPSTDYLAMIRRLENVPFYIDTIMVDLLPVLFNINPKYTDKYFKKVDLNSIFSSKEQAVTVQRNIKTLAKELKMSYEHKLLDFLFTISLNSELLNIFKKDLFTLF
jgi:hypothetical protein